MYIVNFNKKLKISANLKCFLTNDCNIIYTSSMRMYIYNYVFTKKCENSYRVIF